MSLYSKEDNPEFLSLPRKCDVFFIGNVQQFCIFKKQFEEYEQKKQSTILCGIDAEWNSYVMKSRFGKGGNSILDQFVEF